MATAYSINDTILSTQPYLTTTPQVCGTQVLAGTTFALFFLSPDTATQTLLSSTTPVLFGFTLTGGAMLVGKVQLSASVSGSAWLITITVLNTIMITTMCVQTDFF